MIKIINYFTYLFIIFPFTLFISLFIKDKIDILYK